MLFAAAAQAAEHVIDELDVSPDQRGNVVKLNLAFPMRVMSFQPEKHGDLIHVQVQPIAAPPAPPAPPVAVVAARFDADYLHNPKPVYPALSRRNAEEGKVLLKVRVSAQGTALDVAISKSSTFARLDKAAAEAVAQWRFVPAKRGDEPVESSVIVPITFALE